MNMINNNFNNLDFFDNSNKINKSTLFSSYHSNANSQNIHKQNEVAKWYFKNDDDEYVLYGFDEQKELEMNYILSLRSSSNHSSAIYIPVTGYFANCYSNHQIDFNNLIQINISTSISRNIIRFNINSLRTSCVNNSVYTSQSTQTSKQTSVISDNYSNISLINDLISQQTNNCDLISFNIPSYTLIALNEILYSEYISTDIACCTIVIDDHQDIDIDTVLNNYILSQNSLNIIKLYKYNILCDRSMIKYIINSLKYNLIIMNKSGKLLACAKLNQNNSNQYIYNNNDNNESFNPYKYESFTNWYKLLTLFYELTPNSIRNNTNFKMISTFNQKVKILLKYTNSSKTATWSPNINNTHVFNQILMNNEHEDEYKDVAVDDDESESESVSVSASDGYNTNVYSSSDTDTDTDNDNDIDNYLSDDSLTDGSFQDDDDSD